MLKSIDTKLIIFLLTGFKANLVHKKCLADVNATLLATFNRTDGIDGLPEVSVGGVFNYTDAQGNDKSLTIPRCNLEEELDNVSLMRVTSCKWEFFIFVVLETVKFKHVDF